MIDNTAEEPNRPDGFIAPGQTATNGLLGLYGPIGFGQQQNVYTEGPARLGVYEAILAVMADLSVEGIAKGQSAAFEYGGKPRAFRGIDDVMQKLSALLVKHKLLIMPWLESHKVERVEKAKQNGGTTLTHLYSCVWRYKFISTEDGSTHEIRVANETFDTSDKGLGKNMSYAYKYAMLQAFCIPVEGNEEQDRHNPVIGSEAPAARHAAPAPQDSAPNADRNQARAREMVSDTAPRQQRQEPSPAADAATRAPRMMGNKERYSKAGKFADELSVEELYGRIRQLKHMGSKIQEYAGMPGHLADLMLFAKLKHGIESFERETEEVFPPKDMEEKTTPEHLYICVMPGKSTYNKDIRQLDVDSLSRFLKALEGDSRLSMKADRIKLVQEEIAARVKQELKT